MTITTQQINSYTRCLKKSNGDRIVDVGNAVGSVVWTQVVDESNEVVVNKLDC